MDEFSGTLWGTVIVFLLVYTGDNERVHWNEISKSVFLSVDEKEIVFYLVRGVLNVLIDWHIVECAVTDSSKSVKFICKQ